VDENNFLFKNSAAATAFRGVKFFRKKVVFFLYFQKKWPCSYIIVLLIWLIFKAKKIFQKKWEFFMSN